MFVLSALGGVQEISALCTGSEASKATFGEQAAALDDGALTALLAAFRYLKGLGLELWNEAGLALRPVTDPGHMTLSSNALAQLHVLEGAPPATPTPNASELHGIEGCQRVA